MTGKGLLLAAATAWAAMSRPGLAAEEPSLSFAESGAGGFKVEAGFWVSVSSETAWEVLSDYDRLAEFVPSLRSSKVLERRAGRVLLEQVAVGRVFAFSRRVRVVLELRETPFERIVFTDTAGEDFERYRGSWRIEPEHGSTRLRIVYELEAKRRFAAPDFVASGVLRRNTRSLLRALRKEMLRRAGLEAPKEAVALISMPLT